MFRLRFFTSGFSSARRRRLALPSSCSSTSTCRGLCIGCYLCAHWGCLSQGLLECAVLCLLAGAGDRQPRQRFSAVASVPPLLVMQP